MLEAGYSERKGGSEGKKEREGGSFDGDGAEPVENLPTNAEIWWLRCLCLLLPTLSLSLSLSSASFCGQSRRLVAEDMKTMLWNESTRLAYSCAAGCDLSRGCRAKKKKKQKKGNRSRTHTRNWNHRHWAELVKHRDRKRNMKRAETTLQTKAQKGV